MAADLAPEISISSFWEWLTLNASKQQNLSFILFGAILDGTG